MSRSIPSFPTSVQPGGLARFVEHYAGALIIGLVFVGFVLRLAFGLGYWVGKPLMKDEQEYLLLAARMARGEGFNYPPPPKEGPPPRRFERPPGFPFFLAAVLRLTQDPLLSGDDAGTDARLPTSSSEVPASIKVAQSMVGSIGIVLVAALARRAAGNPAAVAAAAGAAVYPPLVWTCGYVLSEPLYSMLALTTVWGLQKAADAPHRGFLLGFGAGALAGVALLTKEAVLFFLPLAAVWLLARRRYAVAIFLAAGVAAATVPWIARNYAVHGRFVLTAAHGGVTLWTGNNPLAIGEGDLAANPEMGRARVALEDSHPGLDNQQLDDIYYREVFRFIREQPGRWVLLELKKLFYTFVPIGPSYRLHSPRYFWASVISYGLLAPLAVAGLWLLVRRGEASRLWALWLLALSMVIVCLVFFPQERFRLPVLDPAGVVAAGVFAALRRRT